MILALNIVNCGSCGGIFGHRLDEDEELTCPYCSHRDDISHFPDVYYGPDFEDSIIKVIK